MEHFSYLLLDFLRLQAEGHERLMMNFQADRMLPEDREATSREVREFIGSGDVGAGRALMQHVIGIHQKKDGA